MNVGQGAPPAVASHPAEYGNHAEKKPEEDVVGDKNPQQGEAQAG